MHGYFCETFCIIDCYLYTRFMQQFIFTEESDYMRPNSQLIIYQTEDGNTKVDVLLENETVWLSQANMAELFQTTKQNVGQHIKNIFNEGELDEISVVKSFFTTAADGKKYNTKFYNLDLIISLGYRIKSHVATQFRQWATHQIKEYIVKGFVLDDERLKNPDTPFDHFDELLRRIQDIRTSKIDHLTYSASDLIQKPAIFLTNFSN